MSRERYKNKKWTHHTKRSNASIFVLREEKGGVGGDAACPRQQLLLHFPSEKLSTISAGHGKLTPIS